MSECGIPLPPCNQTPAVAKVYHLYCVMTPNMGKSHVDVLWIDRQNMQDLFTALGKALREPMNNESDTQTMIWR